MHLLIMATLVALTACNAEYETDLVTIDHSTTQKTITEEQILQIGSSLLPEFSFKSADEVGQALYEMNDVIAERIEKSGQPLSQYLTGNEVITARTSSRWNGNSTAPCGYTWGQYAIASVEGILYSEFIGAEDIAQWIGIRNVVTNPIGKPKKSYITRIYLTGCNEIDLQTTRLFYGRNCNANSIIAATNSGLFDQFVNGVLGQAPVTCTATTTYDCKNAGGLYTAIPGRSMCN